MKIYTYQGTITGVSKVEIDEAKGVVYAYCNSQTLTIPMDDIATIEEE